MNEKNLAYKQDVVAEISEKIQNSQSLVVVEYRGLKVSDITDLRRQLRDEGVDFKVYKNKLAQRAVSDQGYEELIESLTGPNAIAFSDDAVAPSRVLAKFAKKNKNLILKSGIVEGKFVGLETIKELSELPNREGLLAMFIGMLQSPLRKFAYAVKQVSELEPAPEEVIENTVEDVEAAEATPEAEAEVVATETVEAEVDTVPDEVEAVEETKEPEEVEAEVAEVENPVTPNDEETK